MMDGLTGKVSDQAARKVMDELRTLYRARPFTKVIPFNQLLGADPVLLWSPTNAYFEVAKVIVRADMAGIDLAFLDNNVAQPILFAMPPTTEYQEFDLDPGYRSLSYNNTGLYVLDPSGAGVTVKGTIYGWEVNPGGYYR